MKRKRRRVIMTHNFFLSDKTKKNEVDEKNEEKIVVYSNENVD